MQHQTQTRSGTAGQSRREKAEALVVSGNARDSRRLCSVAEYPNGDQRLEDVLYMVTIKRKHNKSTSVLISGFQEWGKVGEKQGNPSWDRETLTVN